MIFLSATSLLPLANLGTNRAALFQVSNAASVAHAVRIDSNAGERALGVYATGTGGSIYGANSGSSGYAGYFTNTSASNKNPALYGYTAAAGQPAIMADGLLQVGKSTRDGRINLYCNGTTTHAITLYSTSQGAGIDLYDDAGNRNVWLAADPDGEGGWLRIDRQPNQAGFLVDANRLDTGNPVVAVYGSDRSVIFDMRSTIPTNDSVKLPADSIASSEILDEPGVASDTGDWWNFASSPMTIASRSITAPANGYVLAIGSVNGWLRQEGVGSTSINIAVSDSELFPSRSATVFVGQSGSYEHPMTHHKLFRVFAGAHTFYLLGTENADSAYVANGELTLIYFPTAYSTVASTSAAPPEESALVATDVKPDAAEKPTAALPRESPEALQRNPGQIRLELEELKTALDEMQAKTAAMNERVMALEAALQTR